jgi:hypothetical protein
MPDDLRHLSREENGFILFTEVEAGALVGAILAACVVYDFLQRLIAWAG